MLLICISLVRSEEGSQANDARASERWQNWEASFTDDAPADLPELTLLGTDQSGVFSSVGKSNEPESDYDQLHFDPARAFCTRPMSCPFVESGGSVSAICPSRTLMLPRPKLTSMMLRTAWRRYRTAP